MLRSPAVPLARPHTPQLAADDARLAELGYRSQLLRGLRRFDNAAIGFATISPVVGLYSVAAVGLGVAGPAWVWALPVALLGQCLLLAVYSELASQFPIANGSYQWSRRLLGNRYGWMTGWVALCGYIVANTTVAYLSAPWTLSLLGIDPAPAALVAAGLVFVALCALVAARGIGAVRRLVRVGIAAEAAVSIGVGLALLLAFTTQDFSLLTETLGAESTSGGSVTAGFLAALAVAGWAFIGFDACVLSAEETLDAARHVPRTIWIALLSVGALVILNAFASVLAHPDPALAVSGADADPFTTAVAASFGGWAGKPFTAVVLLAFLICGLAAQSSTARATFSMARDGALPAAQRLDRVDARGVPITALAATSALTGAGLLLGVEATAIGSLIAFGTAAIYLSFTLIATAALIARLRGTWTPAGEVRLGRLGTPVNALAVGWLVFETVNIAWPRASLAPVGAPAYQVWAAPLVLLLIVASGLVYLQRARPDLAAERAPA